MSVSESKTIPSKDTLKKFGHNAAFSQHSMSYETPTVVASVWVIEPVEPEVDKNALKRPECGEKLCTAVKEVSSDRAQPVKSPVSNPGLVIMLACAAPAKEVASTNAAPPQRIAEHMLSRLRKMVRRDIWLTPSSRFRF